MVHGQKGNILYEVPDEYGVKGILPKQTIVVHEYPIVDSKNNFDYIHITPFAYEKEDKNRGDAKTLAPVSYKAGQPGKFTAEDAKTGLKAVFDQYGEERATIVEKMYRLETSHFKSGGYKNTGTGGMEAKVGHENDAPYYGWDK